MRRKLGYLCLMLALGAGVASAQVRAPNYDHMYCSGVWSTTAVPYDTYLISGEESQLLSTFSGEYVYINKGSSQGVKVGDEFQVLRPDKDRYQPKWFYTQPWLQRAMGKFWKDVGKLRVVNVKDNTSIALVVFTCDYLQRGDHVRPFTERPAPAFKRAKFDRFAPPTGRGAAMVVNAKDFAASAGSNDIIYVNLGSRCEPGLDYRR